MATTTMEQKIHAVYDLKAGYTLGHADIAILKSLARFALATIVVDGQETPALYASAETLTYAQLGELHLKCLSEPMGDAVIPLFTAARRRAPYAPPKGWLMVPEEPSPDHLESIAMRSRHDFGLLTAIQRAAELAGARQMYQECTGQGFYKIPMPSGEE